MPTTVAERQNEIAAEVADLRRKLDELLKRLGQPADRSITAFCKRQGFSRAFYYVMEHRPRELREGRIVRITPEAEREWELARENGSKGFKRRTPPR
jgi:hypothetical protein